MSDERGWDDLIADLVVDTVMLPVTIGDKLIRRLVGDDD